MNLSTEKICISTNMSLILCHREQIPYASPMSDQLFCHLMWWHWRFCSIKKNETCCITINSDLSTFFRPGPFKKCSQTNKRGWIWYFYTCYIVFGWSLASMYVDLYLFHSKTYISCCYSWLWSKIILNLSVVKWIKTKMNPCCTHGSTK
jgi:hypothetical protein